MFGIGPQEVVVIVLLLLVVFGPSKAVSLARALGHFVSEAREHVDEFKDELLHGEEERDESANHPQFDDAGDEAREPNENRTIQESKDELLTEEVKEARRVPSRISSQR